MAFRLRISCYVCDQAFQPRQTMKIVGDENVNKRQIAIMRRDANNHPPLNFNNDCRLYLNCNVSITNEIAAMEADPGALRLNVLSQTASRSCVICNAVNDVHRLSITCRVNAYLIKNIYIPENVRSCAHHLDERGCFPKLVLDTLRSVNRPYFIRGQQLQCFLEQIRNVFNTQDRFNDENNFTDEEFKSISPIDKVQFRNLHTYCDRVPVKRDFRYVSKKYLLTFLCKLRQGLSDDFLKVIFIYNSREVVSSIINLVRKSLLLRFVPQNIGFQAITRQTYIERHVTEFANELYNPEPLTPQAIAVVDATYSYVQKSSCFRMPRQTYSQHKHRHLVKPTMIVAPDGYILSVLGPYIFR